MLCMGPTFLRVRAVWSVVRVQGPGPITDLWNQMLWKRGPGTSRVLGTLTCSDPFEPLHQLKTTYWTPRDTELKSGQSLPSALSGTRETKQITLKQQNVRAGVWLRGGTESLLQAALAGYSLGLCVLGAQFCSFKMTFYQLVSESIPSSESLGELSRPE